ncbi:BLOC-1-related complex subunit 6 [Drosophila sulfurigaster albostrigata]|uniref:BLOC-1-related complex subunit 6 n=1 Tax=Drosophila sulfurigaster albostrigata TaxID=89887 RepID=UPI002D21D1D2|nr:BLOC-1-related complex subunit 6 [Drosophila sulfurigaster albostrigata]
MSRRSQDIPIRPRYGYTDEAEGEEAATNHNKVPQQRNNCGTPASYSEIPFLAQYAGPVPDHVLQDITPTAKKVPPLGSGNESYVNLDSGDDDNDDDDDDEDEDEEPSNSNSKDSSGELSKPSNRPKSLQSTFPYELEGEGATSSTGAMHHFVAHNLESKLRAATDNSNLNSEHTTPSTSTAPISRFLQSRHVPEVDGNVLSDIELEAQYLATSVDNLVENLGNLLHSISSITADNVEVHKNSVKKLTDALDANIKCQYQLLAKTEEITKSMKPTEQLSQRIREIKRLVDMLDSTM